MKKLIPILVVAIFLLVGLINFNLDFTEPPASLTTANEEANNLELLPAEITAESLDEAEEDENSELDVTIIGPELETTTEATSIDPAHHGSRFKVTTNTALVLESPLENQSYSYEELVMVSGHLFEDNNSNGVFDNGQDIPISLARIKISFGDEEWVETDEDGHFDWTKQNLNTVKGVWDLQVIYDGQYTINGSVWYDVDQVLGANEDNDYYLDVNITYNGTDWVYEWPGNGKFDPGVLNESLGYYELGDPIIRDDGSVPGTWRSDDIIVTDPLNDAKYGTIPIMQDLYPYRTEIDYVPLIDEELPNTYDQSITTWADQDGDWDLLSHDVGEDGVGGTGDNGDGDGRPTPGEPRVDEDLNFTRFRKPSKVIVWVKLWHDTEISAVVINSTGKQTNWAQAGETITIEGNLKNKINPSIKAKNKAIKIKIFGNMIPGVLRTDNQGDFNYTYTIPTHSSIRVGIRDIDIMFNDELYDPDYNGDNNSHEFFKATTLSEQDSGPLSIRIYRPAHIEFEKEIYVGYLFKTITINGTIRDDNGNKLSTSILHDDGSSEVLTTSAYHLKFEWGRQIDQYYNIRDQDLLDATGNFTIPNYPITDPYQETGEITAKVRINMNHTMTYYLSCAQSITVTVRSKAAIDVWIDQDMDGNYNEHPDTKKGPLADYITRNEYTDSDGNIWDFNKVVVYGRLTYTERPDKGITGKILKYYWGDEHETYEDSGKTVQTKATHDINLNGKIDNDEMGLFIMPDPEIIYDLPKRIEKSHALGPLTLYMKYEDQSDFIDPIEISIDFNVVAMTKIKIDSGSGIKGENLSITGKLVDDLGSGVSGKELNLYWEDLEGELIVDNKYDPAKLSEAFIGNVTSDKNGDFNYYSEDILTRKIEVGQGYVVAMFDGSVAPYTAKDAHMASISDEVVVDVSTFTKIELKTESKNLRLIRGKSFVLDGQVIEIYEGEKNPDSKVLLTISDTDQMEVYIKNVEQNSEVQIKDITVEYKSEGGFFIAGTVPYDLDVGTAELRLVFKGSKNGYYLGDEDRSYHEIWADTYIKIIAPDVVKKESEDQAAGYFLRDDIHLEKYDSESDEFDEPGLVFQFQLLEVTESNLVKPVEEGRVELTINASYSVFRNFSVKYTDDMGYVNFTFTTPLTDSDWGYQLSSKAQEELEIRVEFIGKDYYLSSETLPIETTHWPYEEPDKPEGWDAIMEEYGWIIWGIVVFVIVFLIVFFFVMQWYTKQMRIKGMRRIIKRAADQLIAGNEYTAVIFKSYQKLGVHLRKYGYLRRDSETFREFEGAVRSALPIDRMSMDQFLHLLEEARYSSHQIGEGQRNDAILNLRAIERSLDTIIVDEGAAIRALERLETEGVKETKIIVGKGPGAGGPKAPAGPQGSVPQLLKKQTPQRSKSISQPPATGKTG